MGNIVDVNTTVSADAYRSLVFFQTFFKKKVTIPFIIVAGMISIANIAGRFMGFYDAGTFLFYMSGIYLALMVVTPIILELQIRRFISSDKTTVGSSHRIVIDDDSISSYANEASAQYAWDKLFEVHETSKAFLFYINSQQAMVLPKADITAEQSGELRGLAYVKMGKKFVMHCK